MLEGYSHRGFDGTALPFPAGKVICVGRNYADHIQELNNPIPSEPLLFIKPSTSLCRLESPIQLPVGQGECHNELEVAILIGTKLKEATDDVAFQGIWGCGLGLDLTLRDVQNNLKAKGLPWERSKGFDNACPLSNFIPIDQITDLQNIDFTLHINDRLIQKGNTGLMLYDVTSLISEISHTFTLLPGDVVMTGTPKGVGPLYSGDKVRCTFNDMIAVSTSVTQVVI